MPTCINPTYGPIYCNRVLSKKRKRKATLSQARSGLHFLQTRRARSIDTFYSQSFQHANAKMSTPVFVMSKIDVGYSDPQRGLTL
jgi:hypothetical protein